MSSNGSSEKSKAITRRGFLKMASVAGITGATMATSGCLIQDRTIGEDGWLPRQYEGVWNMPVKARGRIAVDPNNPSLARNDRLCILCGQCIEVCYETQTVHGYFEIPPKGDFACIHCGQCSNWCPTMSLYERDHISPVRAALNDPNKFVFAQTAPGTRIGLGEEFGQPAGTWVQGQQVAALKTLGFDRIFNSLFSADLTIMEEGTEFIKRVRGELADNTLPMITSCCPGWIKFCEYFFPDLIPNLSTCKSPQGMLGAVAKTHYAEANGIDVERMVSVSVMPCASKKWEMSRDELNAVDASEYWGIEGLKDIDYVLTTRELGRFLREERINLNNLPEAHYDNFMGEGSGAGLIFANSGGVMQAAIRSVYFLLTGQPCPPGAFQMRNIYANLEGIKEASVAVPGVGNVNVAVVQGLRNTRMVMEAVQRGEAPYHFIEIMACPGGCISGGGQPRTAVPPSDSVRMMRTETIYAHDAVMDLRESHENSEVLALYENFLGYPMSELAYKLLHTKYIPRDHLVNTSSRHRG